VELVRSLRGHEDGHEGDDDQRLRQRGEDQPRDEHLVVLGDRADRSGADTALGDAGPEGTQPDREGGGRGRTEQRRAAALCLQCVVDSRCE
jgi:hypothetical protein